MNYETKIRIENISDILLNFNRSINLVKDEKELAQKACTTAVLDLGYHSASFGLLSNNGNFIVSIAHFGEDCESEKSIALFIDKNTVNNHVAVSAIRNCEITSTYPLEKEQDRANKITGENSNNTMAFPIMNSTHALGAFYVSFNESDRIITNEDIRILEDFVRDCSRGIHLIQLNRENIVLKEKSFESEKRFRSIFENSVVPMGLTTLDGKFCEVNKALCKTLGYEANELLNKVVDEFNFPEDRHKYSAEIEKLIEGQLQSIHFTKRYICKNGNVIWVDVTSSAAKDISGKPVLLSFVAQNITSAVKSYDKLKTSEEKYRKFFDNDLSGDFITSINGEIKLCNTAFVQILGYKSTDELIGKNVSEFYARPQDREMFIDALKLSKTIVWYENNFVHKNGTRITVMENAFANFDDAGNITEIQGYIFDITEKIKAEHNVQLLTKAVEQSPTSIVITNPSGDIEYVNPKFTQLTGYSFNELIGKNPRILKSGHTSEDEYKKLWDTISSGNEWVGEFQNINKQGEYYWESAVISPIRNYKGEITNFVAVKEDISEKKKMLEELIHAKEAAESSNKLKSEFISQMSHEIRTPLTIVLSNHEYIKDVLEEENILDNDLLRAFKQIETGGKRIIRTIELILSTSEVVAGSFNNRPEPLNVYSKILEGLYDEFKIAAKEERLQLVLLKNTGNTFSTVDLRAAHLILFHLIENAIKFTNEGGITITVDNDSNSQLIISIEDSGIGMSQEYMQNIFKLFCQEDHGYSRQYDGNGLGLALTKTLCDLNNIIISVKSDKGRGSIFTLIFPK